MDTPLSAVLGGENMPDAGGTGAPMAPAPSGIPSTAAPLGPSAPAPVDPELAALRSQLHPAAPSTLQQILRVAIPAIAAGVYAKQGYGIGPFMQSWQSADLERQRQADIQAQHQLRIAQAIKAIEADQTQQRRTALAEQKEAALEKAKLDAAREKHLHDIATHGLDAASKGGLFKTLNGMIDRGENVDGYLSSKLGAGPDTPSLKDLVDKGYIFRTPDGHFAYSTDVKDLEPLTKTLNDPTGQYKYTIDRESGQIDPTSWEYLGETNKTPPDPLLEELRRAHLHQLQEEDADVQNTGQAIIEGTQPPDLSRLYGKSLKVRSYLYTQGFDLAAATQDWQATTRMIQSLNSPQQLRLQQTIRTASQSLDVIDKLADKWHGGAFPPLNKANLIAARNGAYGTEAAEIATQLEGQITDVTSELGQVYQGGYSPTDQALGLAQKNLSADWDEAVLHSMTKLARKNLQIRQNSMQWAVPAGASPNNPYYHQQNPGDPFGIGLGQGRP